MITYPNIDPIALHLGPAAVHWYGLMYLIGFLGGWMLLLYRSKKPGSEFTAEQVSDILFYSALGIIIGGRVGYMLFYAWTDLLNHPLLIFQIWQGGMSFHGGMLGVIVAMAIYAYNIKKPLGVLTDFIAPVVPIGLGTGRIGNFINGELWGKVTDLPWGMVFPTGGLLPRHPSQLYEFLLEGVALFLILWFYSATPRPRWAVSGMFLFFYGLFRFAIEFVRVPDVQIGYIAFGWLTKGQLLSLPMIIIGLIIVLWSYRRAKR